MTRISSKMTIALVAPFAALAAVAACSSTPSETFGASGATGTAGTTTTGGVPTTSGGTNSNPTAGSNSSTAGSNSPTAGSNSPTGGAATGGTPATAGTGGSAPNAGSAGTSAGGGGACDLDCVAGVKNDNMDALTNSYIMVGCYSKAAQDCITLTGQCPNQNSALPMEEQGYVSKQKFKIGGTAGTHYLLTINVNGMSEAKYYEKGTRAAGLTDPPNPDAVNGTDTFYTGGNPVNFENYNIYKITTFDGAGAEVAHYYLNSMPKTNTPYEDHSVYPIAYTHDIEIVGGGSVEYLLADRNCHAVDNCGIGHQSASCAQTAGRKIPNENDLVLPTNYMGKPVSQLNLFGGNSQPFHSQVIHIVAKSVKPK
jgi:hypothetical protein